MKENLFFQLSKKLEYSAKGKDQGNFLETATIEFEPPNMSTFDEAADFEQMFMGSLVSAGNFAKGKGTDEEKEPDKGALEELKENTPKPHEIKDGGLLAYLVRNG